ncbi:cyclic nucleotide-gated ion channel [Striga asiatica]|uniref:Cyclic nucleotide-gated ion channel n=1 Tax=Striga asiatica TaxID=4170 RepID=A0A5A7P3F2_STRAF|nr:cyclic nucleotide-gated ion channel [Striga asiatica]
MDPSERDKVPMLQGSYIQSDEGSKNSITNKGLSTRTRSASMSIPTNSIYSSEYERSLVGFTGPLRTEKGRNSIAQTSVDLYALRRKANEPKIERFPSSVIDRANDDSDDFVGRNENLYKSGQLGMCSDPYCTTCPMYDNVNGYKYNRTPQMLDAKHGNCGLVQNRE